MCGTFGGPRHESVQSQSAFVAFVAEKPTTSRTKPITRPMYSRGFARFEDLEIPGAIISDLSHDGDQPEQETFQTD